MMLESTQTPRGFYPMIERDPQASLSRPLGGISSNDLDSLLVV